MDPPPMKIIALAQGKGGAAKSTTAIHLACEAIAHGESAAIIDMDESQQSSKNWANRRSSREPEVIAARTFKLKEEIERLRKDGKRWAFIDLPGRNEPTSGAGIVAADFVIIPTRPATVDFEASVSTVRACVRAQKRYAYLLSAVPLQGEKSRARKFTEELRDIKQPVCPISIGLKQDVSDALTDGKSVREHKPGCSSQVEFEMLFFWLKEQFGEYKSPKTRR